MLEAWTGFGFERIYERNAFNSLIKILHAWSGGSVVVHRGKSGSRSAAALSDMASSFIDLCVVGRLCTLPIYSACHMAESTTLPQTTLPSLASITPSALLFVYSQSHKSTLRGGYLRISYGYFLRSFLRVCRRAYTCLSIFLIVSIQELLKPQWPDLVDMINTISFSNSPIIL